jgi:hypothetical protein
LEQSAITDNRCVGSLNGLPKKDTHAVCTAIGHKQLRQIALKSQFKKIRNGSWTCSHRMDTSKDVFPHRVAAMSILNSSP